MAYGLAPAEIIQEARSWLGTPYRHQGRQKEIAVDCVGLVFGVLRNLGVGSDRFWAAQNRRWGAYKMLPDGHTLRDGFGLFMPEYPVSKAQPGDCLLIMFGGMPRHTAILTDEDTIIHAYSGAKKCVEQRFVHTWRRDSCTAYRICEIDVEGIEEMRF